MSDGSLNQISMSIGGLEADVKNIGRTVERIFSLMKEYNDNAAKALKDHSEHNDNQFEELTKQINELQSFKSRIYGTVATIGVIATSITQFAIQYITRK